MSREFVAEVSLRCAIPTVVLTDHVAKFLSEMLKKKCVHTA